MIRFIKEIFKQKAYNIDSKFILDKEFFNSFCQRTDLKDVVILYQEEENHHETDFDIKNYWQDFTEWLEYHLAYVISEIKHYFKELVKNASIKVYVKPTEYSYYMYEGDENIDQTFDISVDNVNWLETYRINLFPCVCKLKKIIIVI